MDWNLKNWKMQDGIQISVDSSDKWLYSDECTNAPGIVLVSYGHATFCDACANILTGMHSNCPVC